MRSIPTLSLLVILAACGTSADGGAAAPEPVEAPEGPFMLLDGTVDGAAVPLVEGYRITLTIDGRNIGGTAACNGYGGTIAGQPPDITIAELAQTEMGCEPPVMASEGSFLAGLSRVTSMTEREGLLLLTGPGVELSFAPLPPVSTAELIGTVWELDTLYAGETASSVSGDPATLELRDDGTLVGSTGCRSLSGRYVITGDEVLFVELAAEGNCPAELEAQDSQVVAVLADGFTAAIDGDRLTLTSAGAEGLGYRGS